MPERPGFLTAEDNALKARLVDGLTVTDDRDNARDVNVRFRFPEGEIEKLYPFVTIDLVDIRHARDRQHSEVTYYYPSNNGASPNLNDYASYKTLAYFPSEYDETDLWSTVGASADYLASEQMIPVDLTYQISTWCRHQKHDRELTAGMLRYVFPLQGRSFILIPEDGTRRRCDLLDWRPADIRDQEAGYNKRVFRKIYTVSINSELPPAGLRAVKKVLSVSGTISDINGTSTETW